MQGRDVILPSDSSPTQDILPMSPLPWAWVRKLCSPPLPPSASSSPIAKGLRTPLAFLGKSCGSWMDMGVLITCKPHQSSQETEKAPILPAHSTAPLSFWVPSLLQTPPLPGDSAWTAADHRRTDARACLQAELCPSVLQSPSLHNEDGACTSHGGCCDDGG